MTIPRVEARTTAISVDEVKRQVNCQLGFNKEQYLNADGSIKAKQLIISLIRILGLHGKSWADKKLKKVLTKIVYPVIIQISQELNLKLNFEK